jgi:hypothetical protein
MMGPPHPPDSKKKNENHKLVADEGVADNNKAQQIFLFLSNVYEGLLGILNPSAQKSPIHYFVNGKKHGKREAEKV